MKNKHFRKSIDSNGNIPVKTDVFDIAITNERKGVVLESVLKTLEIKDKKYFIVTPNPEIVVYASKHPAFKKILNSAEIALCDGMQLFRAAAFVGKPLQERITGVEFMETLCKYISEKPITVGFLGGRDGVAKMTAERLVQRYPGLKVGFVGEEWSSARQRNDQPQSIACDILFVAFGFPKQEEWMFANLSKVTVTVMMGVGGAFDYISGRVPRAPQWIQSLGFEWLYRLGRQPWRWRRQASLIEFIWMAMKEKIKKEK